jgi:hypothetical protein
MKGYYQITIHLISYKLLLIQRAEILDLSFHLFISAIHALLDEVYMDLMLTADIYLSP